MALRSPCMRPFLLPALAVALVGAVLLLLSAPGPLAAQEVLAGRVLSSAGPLPGAEVRLRGPGTQGPATEGAAPSGTETRGPVLTREDGSFLVPGLAPGSWEVTASAPGHRPATRVVEVAAGAEAVVELRLESEAVALDPVVVTGTLRETRVAESPVKVDVVSSRLLQRGASRSLMESINQVNGLYQQVDCAVCYTNNIRINGMEGPYSQILVDGMPIMGALASVYGLNGIDPAMIERLEILKGPQSTLYGSEAMGGVVNVITKDARFTPGFTLDVSRTSFDESQVNVGLSASGESADALLSGTVLHNDRFLDENGDGFSDVTLDTRVALFAKGRILRDRRPFLEGSAKFYWEDRFGGVDGWTEDDLGSDRVYGESIRTTRFESMGRARLSGSVRLEGSYAFHDQDSWYGNEVFLATQHIGFGQLLWDLPLAAGHDLLVGATLRLESYDDQTPATPEPVRRAIPGLFVQDEWRLSEGWTLLGGGRVDRYGEHGAVFSPRLAARWEPLPRTTVRLNAGTGFRAVNIFTEDHAALTGAREVVIAEDLRPERSRSLALNVNQVLELGRNPMMVDVDLFHTRFANRILPNYDLDPNQIVYRNLPGEAETRGVALSLNQNFADLPFLYSLGVTIQDVALLEDGVRTAELFAPDFKGVWSLSWTFAGALTVDWSGQVMGSMRLPEYPEPFRRPTESAVWTTHDLQGTWRLARGSELYLSVRNALDFTQGSPLVDPGRPFGDAFDTSYVWGPIAGRRLAFGVRLAQGR